MRGQERPQVFRHADRAYARSAAAVGHRKGLVQVQVAHVCAYVARVRQTHLRVHVRPVHVQNLAARIVYDFHDVADAALEYAVRRGVGHHQAA